MALKKEYLAGIWKKYGKQTGLFLAFFLMPLICCALLCRTQGVSLTKLTPFGIAGNDEVIYQKMVEGVVRDGMPAGYFGYNESHAAVGTFSTWSPVLLLPWSILGSLFGWGAGSAIVYNIVLLMLAMGSFYILVKPDVRQALFILSLYAATAFISWYALLTLPEIACYALIILLCGLTVNLHRAQKLWKIKIGISFVIAALLTWMRPYYIILLLLPGFELIKRSKKKGYGIVAVSSIFLITGGIYVWINQNMCAPFFTDLLDFSWTSMLFSNPLGAVRALFSTFMKAFGEYLTYVRGGVMGSSLAGAQCAALLPVMGCLLFNLRQDIKEKKRDMAIITGIAVCFMFLTYCAAAVVFEISASGKHFGELIVLGIFIIGWKKERKTIPVMLAALSWIFFMQVQYYPCMEKNEGLETQIAAGKAQLEDSLIIVEEGDCWDNTVIWVFSDDSGYIWWQGLYALPSGIGINLCTREYVLEHWEELQAKYLYTSGGDTIDLLCENRGILLADYGGVHVWELRK